MRVGHTERDEEVPSEEAGPLVDYGKWKGGFEDYGCFWGSDEMGRRRDRFFNRSPSRLKETRSGERSVHGRKFFAIGALPSARHCLAGLPLTAVARSDGPLIALVSL